MCRRSTGVVLQMAEYCQLGEILHSEVNPKKIMLKLGEGHGIGECFVLYFEPFVRGVALRERSYEMSISSMGKINDIARRNKRQQIF